MKTYVVSYDGWGIEVKADTTEQAKGEAYESFKRFYPAPVSRERFFKNIREVREI